MKNMLLEFFKSRANSKISKILIFMILLGIVGARGLAARHGAPEITNNVKTVLQASPFVMPNMPEFSCLNRRDVAVFFETRGVGPSIITQDGRYISAGPLQFNATPGFMLDQFLNSPEVRARFGARIDGFGGMPALQRIRNMHALNANNPAIAGLRALLNDPDFIDMYFAFADQRYAWWKNEVENRFEINILSRGEIAQGFFKTIINHRKNDVFHVANRMAGTHGANAVNMMDDKTFVLEAHKALELTLNQTLARHPSLRQILNNYRATLAHIMPYFEQELMLQEKRRGLMASAMEKHLANAVALATPLQNPAIVDDIMRIASNAIAENKNGLDFDYETVALIIDIFIDNLSEYEQSLLSNILIASTSMTQTPLRIDNAGIRPTPAPVNQGLLARATRIKRNFEPEVRGLYAKAECILSAREI